jgi:calcium-dependent protein kinase
MGCCVSKNPPVHQTQREAGAGGQKQEIAHGPGGHRQQLPPDHGIVNHQLHHDIGEQIHNNRGDGEMKKKAVAAASAASAATVKPIRKSSRITAASCDIQNNAPLHPTAPLHGKRINFGYGRDFDEKYSLGKLLGHGQFGYTYVGTEKATSNQVAVKCIEKKKVSLFCRIRRVTHLTLLLRASPSHFLQSFQGLKIKHFSSRLVPIWKEMPALGCRVLEQFLVHSKMHNLIDAGGLLEESILECTVWVQEVQEKQHIAW